MQTVELITRSYLLRVGERLATLFFTKNRKWKTVFLNPKKIVEIRRIVGRKSGDEYTVALLIKYSSNHPYYSKAGSLDEYIEYQFEPNEYLLPSSLKYIYVGEKISVEDATKTWFRVKYIGRDKFGDPLFRIWHPDLSRTITRDLYCTMKLLETNVDCILGVLD